ncbi:MAG TPA: hypothetical protein VIB11_12035 [Pedococcus sp.]|uniref:hypothetical protein n=1 Tax=Pedococcus sp. TaxID=2860345 RepID=UPI002F926D07
MTTFAAIAACTLLAALGIFQLLLAGGAPLGRFAWGGQHPGVLPARLRVGSAVSALVYAAMAAVLLDRAGLMDTGLSDRAITVATWVLVGYFVLGTAMNLASRSRDERRVMAPTAGALAALSLVVGLG